MFHINEINTCIVISLYTVSLMYEDYLFSQYYRHPDGLSSNTSPVSSPQDPTRGKLNNAVYFLFKPMNWVEHNTLMMIEAGMQRLRFDLIKGEEKRLTNNTPKVSLLSIHFRNNTLL